MTLTSSEIVESVSQKWLPLVDAIEKATGRRPHLCTALRWCTKPNRFGIQRESRVLGGRRLTTVGSVLAFTEATTAASKGGMFAPAQTPHQQDVAAQRDAKKLAARLAKS